MPGLSGLELQTRLHAEGLRIPVIFMTGYLNEGERVRAMQAGAVAFLSKPSSGVDLILSLERALKGRGNETVNDTRTTKCAGLIDDILRSTEFVTIVTSGNDGPYLVGNWGDHLRVLRHVADADTIVLPAGRYRQTEQNLRKDSHITLMAASRHIHNMHGGIACLLRGHGEIVTSGSTADAVKLKFPWARGALLIHVEEVSTQTT
jgi:response regulator receiver domain-containing protein